MKLMGALLLTFVVSLYCIELVFSVKRPRNFEIDLNKPAPESVRELHRQSPQFDANISPNFQLNRLYLQYHQNLQNHENHQHPVSSPIKEYPEESVASNSYPAPIREHRLYKPRAVKLYPGYKSPIASRPSSFQRVQSGSERKQNIY
ncbi:uncharacterized protein LOC117173139 [Belonocnema kinseyi]|uniref:uncharacterized protein LOC117173139 n=1 Tax=Belonocnema kinseyi TaxID=2817044 RepID=UPI00143D39AA|nr:uncharacterized protein LOC117173139 [Belonocnema kinseyi]